VDASLCFTKISSPDDFERQTIPFPMPSLTIIHGIGFIATAGYDLDHRLDLAPAS
jgi:hypothetical protein